MADIPGLIEGAHRGAGLGHRFLGHVERCRVLLHLVDVTGEPVAAWRTLRDELAAYGSGLADKQEVLALTKTDAAPEGYAEDVRDALLAAGAGEVAALSSVGGAGVRELLRLMSVIEAAREAEAAPTEDVPWSP